MRTNVKVSVIGRVHDETKGVMYSSTVATGLEGNLVDLRDRLSGLNTGAQPFTIAGATHKLLFNPAPMMADGAYLDKIRTYVEEGVTVTITHKRHPLLKIWMELDNPEQFVVAHIKDGDTYGSRLSLMLKELPRG
jgi:hypothetical protein